MSVNQQWADFFNEEFNLFLLGPLDVLIYLVIAIFCNFAVKEFGPTVLRGQYRNHLWQGEYEEDGVVNIVYRIVSPVLWVYFVLLLLNALTMVIGLNWIPAIRWMPVFMYWVVMIAIRIPVANPSYPFWVLLVQMLTSVLTAVYFDWAVVCKLPIHGLIAFDQSNIGWQVLIAIFFAIANIVLVGITGGIRKYQNRLRKAAFHSTIWLGYSLPSLDFETEKKLFQYRRQYKSLFPERVIEDKMLMSFVYLVMLIEDSNRPTWFRSLERLFFKTGLVKSTGIMQVRSDKALSDEESVRLAMPIIIDIWDRFLTRTAKSSSSGALPIISFSNGWYRYSCDEMYRLTSIHLSELYGEYCGTSTLDIRNAFAFATVFVLRNERPEYLDSIYVRSELFDCSASWCAGRELCYVNGALSVYPGDVPAFAYGLKAICNTMPTKELVDRATSAMGDFGLMVISVRFIEGLRCSIVARSEEQFDENILKNALPEWILIVDKQVS